MSEDEKKKNHKLDKNKNDIKMQPLESYRS